MAKQRWDQTSVLLCIVVIAGSAEIVWKYAGATGILVQSLATVAVVGWVLDPFRAWGAAVPEAMSRLVAALAVVLLGVGVLIAYSITNVHSPGAGTEGDDMLRQGTQALLHVRYPYYEKTYLGHDVSVLPGALLLAVPFVLLGNIALANVGWAVVFLYFLKRELGRTGGALAVFGLLLLISPGIWHQFATGGDRFSSGVYVLVPLVGVMSSKRLLNACLWAAALGVAFCSRVFLFAFFPLVLAGLVRRRGWRSGLMITAVAGFVTLALIFPFAIYDFGGMTPITVATKEKLVRSGVSEFVYFGIMFGAAVLVIALAAWTRVVTDVVRNAAIVMVMAFVALAAASSLALGTVYLEFTSYVQAVVPFVGYLACVGLRHDGHARGLTPSLDS